MLVLAVFLSISAVGVAFLLRFLFALESDLRSHGRHSARVERIRVHGVPASSGASVPAPVLVMAYPNGGLTQQTWRGSVAAGIDVNETSYIKRA